jgi:inner membrane protein
MSAEPFASLGRSPVIRLLVVMFLAVVLQVPILMIEGLIAERRTRRDTALEQVASSWGRAQSVVGPILVIPYERRNVEIKDDGRRVVHLTRHRLRILPRTLQVEGRLAPQERRRGIFSIPVYAADLVLRGTFAPLDPAAFPLPAGETTPDWSRARLVVGIGDPRSIQEATQLDWGGRKVAFLPGTDGLREAPAGIHAPLQLAPSGEPVAFSLPLRIHGSVGFRIAPAGEQTDVRLTSPWPSPSFQGSWLPVRHTVGDQGFEAHWSVPNLGRGIPSYLADERESAALLSGLSFGVDLLAPVDTYRLAERSVKYAFLFLVFTLGFLWLVEVLIGTRVHPVQLLLVGAALCVFYLLELSLAEHLGFVPAYAIATVAIVAMITAYAAAFLGGWRRAFALGVAVAGLYGFLFIVLVNEDAALLVGSIGLFVALGAVMYLTRRVDWSRGGAGVAPTG